jgi:L-iditol 2-dehydrogenase
MKSLALVEYGRFELRGVPTPPIGPRDVLVRVTACGICGSDVHGMHGSTGTGQTLLVDGGISTGATRATK